MHELVAVLGSNDALTNQARNLHSAADAERIDSHLGIALKLTPGRAPAPRKMSATDGKGAALLLDGYLLMESVPEGLPLTDHLNRFAKKYAEFGLDIAIASVIAGAFNLIILDERRNVAFALSDPFGSVPLYMARTTEAVAVSSNPVRLAGLLPQKLELDRVACAEIALFGYPLGTRFLASQISTMAAGSALRWCGESRLASIINLPRNPFRIIPGRKNPSVDEVADLVEIACKRLVSTDRKFAHLLSGGMDSRLLLAAWPDSDLVSYTYGHPDSADVKIAADVARTKGGDIQHIDVDGDQVAELLPDMFAGNGQLVYPHRYIAANAMASAGANTVIDGFLGDVLLGGTYYSNDRHSGGIGGLLRFLTIFVDQKISVTGLDHISEQIFADLSHDSNLLDLTDMISHGFASTLDATKDQILDDIHSELTRLRSDSDSVAILTRNFLMANRGRHAISQQGVMSRSFLDVSYPYTNDFALLEALLKIRPKVAAYRRFYTRLFARHYPDYAGIPVASTMLPLSYSPPAHKWAAIANSKGVRVPYLTRNTGLRRRPIDWAGWLHDSENLRLEIGRLLRDGNIQSERLSETLDGYASGTMQGSGQIFHMGAIAGWKCLLNA